ncbi:MAG: hypothetical protein [Caudoviricetes sp.]|nr:MAG: hypothetical protein [Caudoviricetes sp.]
MARMSDPYVRDMLDELEKARDALWTASVTLTAARDDMRIAGYHESIHEVEYEQIYDLTSYKNSVTKLYQNLDKTIAVLRGDKSNVQPK